MISPTIDSDKSERITESITFFNMLYGKIFECHFSYLIKFKDYTKIYAFNVSDKTQLEAMARKAIELSDSGFDIWHSVNPVSVEPTDGKRGDEKSVSYQTAVVADIDIRSDAHKGDPAKLAADFDEAKSFLPFTPSIIINSGYGLHAYYIFDSPIKITDNNREEIKRRNNLLLDIIRQRANGKKIDGVGDLPRILRTPGTFNYKLGKDNAPLCHIVENSGLRFSSNELDEKLNALAQTQKNVPHSKIVYTSNNQYNHFSTQGQNFDDNPDLKEFRIRRMLDYISVVDGEYEKWLGVGFALFNEGMALSVWEQWSRSQPEFKEGECEQKWNGFHHDPNGISIASLYQWAIEGGYVEKEIRNDWYQIHPELKPSAKRNMDETTKQELDDAIIWLDTLEPENFTADDARSIESIHKVALAAAFGFSSSVENFFKIIKDAKAIAKNRIKEADAGLTKKLTDDELNNLTAFVEGINIKFLRREVDREITEIKRAQNKFRLRQARDNAKAEAIKHAQEREQTVEDNIQKLIELRAEYMKNPSSELAAQIQNLILHTCDVKIDRYTGKISAVKATQRNANLIFTYDPYIDGLFG